MSNVPDHLIARENLPTFVAVAFILALLGLSLQFYALTRLTQLEQHVDRNASAELRELGDSLARSQAAIAALEQELAAVKGRLATTAGQPATEPGEDAAAMGGASHPGTGQVPR